MKEFNIIAKGDVSLVLKKTNLVLPTNTKKKIDEIWKHLKNNNVSLHDGKSAIVKNIKKKSQDTIVDIVFLDYSTIIVDRENPDLNIGVSQIGVSGMIILNKDKKIVFAHRGKSTTEHSGQLELVPSGNLDNSIIIKNDTVDYVSKLVQEFEEETGIPISYIQKLVTLGLVRDNVNKIYDVCCLLELNMNEKDFQLEFVESTEYSEPIIIRIDELESYLEKNYNRIVPTSKALIECYLDNTKSS